MAPNASLHVAAVIRVIPGGLSSSVATSIVTFVRTPTNFAQSAGMAEPGGVSVIDLVAEARRAAAAPAVQLFKVNGLSYTCQGAVNKLRCNTPAGGRQATAELAAADMGQHHTACARLRRGARGQRHRQR
jgi:hypothetical protein